MAAAPIEKKTAASASASVIVGVVAWILVTYVPAFHSGLPPALATFLPWVVSAVGASAASYFTAHTPREEEIVTAAVKLLETAGVQLPKTTV